MCIWVVGLLVSPMQAAGLGNLGNLIKLTSHHLSITFIIYFKLAPSLLESIYHLPGVKLHRHDKTANIWWRKSPYHSFVARGDQERMYGPLLLVIVFKGCLVVNQLSFGA